jgi:hypothetical protein
MQVANGALHLNADGTGEVLIFPYYNVNNSFQTNFSITNTTTLYKIVKLRFRESDNSHDVLDFNVYMSPEDVWTGTVRQIDGKANLLSTDNTCTFPPNDELVEGVGVLNDTGWNFKTAYDNVDDEDPLEGYLEVFEIGNIPVDLRANDDGESGISGDDTKISTGLKHDSDGMPADCNVVVAGWTKGVGMAPTSGSSATVPFGGSENADDWTAQGYLDAPNGGLYGMSIFLDVPQGGAYVADPVAIANWSTHAQHFRPDVEDDFLLPSLASGDITFSQRLLPGKTIFSETGNAGHFPPVLRVVNFAEETINWPRSVDVGLNDGDDQTPRSGTNPGPIAHVLAATSVMNDYFIDPDFDGATDWVVTFPMRKHGIADGYWSNKCDRDEAASDEQTGTSESSSANVCFRDGDEAVKYKIAAYDREEDTAAPSGFQVSPVLSGGSKLLPREVNVVNFVGSSDSVLGSPNVITVDTGTDFTAGWARIEFTSAYGIGNLQLSDQRDADEETLVNFFPDASQTYDSGVAGVPVIGFAAIRGNNTVGSTFGETTPYAVVASCKD